MNNKLHIALVQANLIWENPKKNFEHFDHLLQGIDTKTDIILLPEVFSTGFTMKLENLEKPIGKTSFEWLQNKAKLLNKIIVGSILFAEKKLYYNRLFWMYPTGNFSYYDKRHLFQMGNEHKTMTAGNRRVVVPFKDTNFMLQICYDLRFPVWSRNFYDKKNNTHNYDVLVYIANWPEVRKNAYLSLLKARAIENQAYVIWVNRVGKDKHGINHTGDSQVIDPLGNTIAQMPENKEGILYASVDLQELQTIRNNFKVGLDWDDFRV